MPFMKVSRSLILSVRAFLSIQGIGSSLFAVWSLEFEVVSDAHELNALQRCSVALKKLGYANLNLSPILYYIYYIYNINIEPFFKYSKCFSRTATVQRCNVLEIYFQFY